MMMSALYKNIFILSAAASTTAAGIIIRRRISTLDEAWTGLEIIKTFNFSTLSNNNINNINNINNRRRRTWRMDSNDGVGSVSAVTEVSSSGKREEEEGEEEEPKKKKQKLKRFNKDGTEIVLSTRADSKRSSVIDKAIRERIESKMGLAGINKETREHIGVTKPRTHVNPLTSANMKPVESPTADYWIKMYENPLLPLFVDIGCAGGRFSICAAQHERWKTWNHLGLEIRGQLVVRANLWAENIGLRNVHYIAGNANTSLEPILINYPGKVMFVAIQFPDPHFKRKHHKRRVVNRELLDVLTRVMSPGATLFMQSDVEEVIAQMRDRTDLWACPPFRRDGGEYTPRDTSLIPALNAESKTEECWTADGKKRVMETTTTSSSSSISGQAVVSEASRIQNDFGDFLTNKLNPVEVPTEREVQNEALGLPIYRVLYKLDPPTSTTTTSAASATSATSATSAARS
jgi:tRNA (guanine-N(7)-)-methyltransferase